MDFITEDYMRKQGFEIVDSDTKDYGGGRNGASGERLSISSGM